MSYVLVANTVAQGLDGGTTSNIDTTGATLLVVGICSFGTDPTTISDSNSNTWNALTIFTTGGGQRVRLFYALNPIVGSGHSFTFSATGSAAVILVSAFSGADTTSPFDSENGSGSSPTPGAVSPSEDNELIVTIVCDLSSAATIDSGFTVTDSVAFIPGTALQGGMAYLIQTAAASANPTWNDGSASSIACFKAAGGGGGNRRRRILLMGAA